MPIYEYKCKGCGHIFEEYKLITEECGTEHCPKCGKPKAERIMSAFATSGGEKTGLGGNGCSSSGPVR